MLFRIDILVWVLAVGICVTTTLLLFIPATGNIYFSVGRNLINVVFFIGLISIGLIWVRSFKLKGWRNHIMAVIKSAVLVTIFVAAYVILAVSHSGI